MYLEVASRAPAEIAFECRRSATEHLLTTGYIGEGMEILSGLLAELGVSWPKTPRRALLSVMWQRARLFLRGLSWRERPPETIDRRALILLDAYKVVGLGLVGPTNNQWRSKRENLFRFLPTRHIAYRVGADQEEQPGLRQFGVDLA